MTAETGAHVVDSGWEKMMRDRDRGKRMMNRKCVLTDLMLAEEKKKKRRGKTDAWEIILYCSMLWL